MAQISRKQHKHNIQNYYLEIFVFSDYCILEMLLLNKSFSLQSYIFWGLSICKTIFQGWTTLPNSHSWLTGIQKQAFLYLISLWTHFPRKNWRKQVHSKWRDCPFFLLKCIQRMHIEERGKGEKRGRKR